MKGIRFALALAALAAAVVGCSGQKNDLEGMTTEQGKEALSQEMPPEARQAMAEAMQKTAAEAAQKAQADAMAQQGNGQ